MKIGTTIHESDSLLDTYKASKNRLPPRARTVAMAILAVITLPAVGLVEVRATGRISPDLTLIALPENSVCRPPETLSRAARAYNLHSLLSIDVPRLRTHFVVAVPPSPPPGRDLGFVDSRGAAA